jgi:hypothetical protein
MAHALDRREVAELASFLFHFWSQFFLSRHCEALAHNLHRLLFSYDEAVSFYANSVVVRTNVAETAIRIYVSFDVADFAFEARIQNDDFAPIINIIVIAYKFFVFLCLQGRYRLRLSALRARLRFEKVA